LLDSSWSYPIIPRMPEFLLQFVHPALEKSVVNKTLLEHARGLDGVFVNDLYQEYPDFDIDTEREKKLMEQSPSVIFQFPLYWYSSPSLLKEWFDLVLQYGWAYGKGATALVGKRAHLAVTTGASEASYSREGHNAFRMDEFLCPIYGTLKLCGMEVGDPFFVHDALHLETAELDDVAREYVSWLKEG